MTSSEEIQLVIMEPQNKWMCLEVIRILSDYLRDRELYYTNTIKIQPIKHSNAGFLILMMIINLQPSYDPPDLMRNLL